MGRRADQLHCERLTSSPSGVLGPLLLLLVAGCCGRITDVAEMVLEVVVDIGDSVVVRRCPRWRWEWDRRYLRFQGKEC